MADQSDLSFLAQVALADADKQASEIMADGRRKSIDEVIFERRKGTGDINEIFYIDEGRSKCKLVVLRITFNANGEAQPYSTATVRVYEFTQSGEEYNCQLHRITERGPDENGDADVFLQIEQESTKDPSPWSIPKGSGFKVRWTSPNSNYRWAIEIGLSRAR